MAKIKVTLEEIRQRQDVLRADLERKKYELRHHFDFLRQPKRSAGGMFQHFATRVQTFTYVLDAVFLGYRVYRALTGKKRMRGFWPFRR